MIDRVHITQAEADTGTSPQSELTGRVALLEQELARLAMQRNAVTLCVFSGDLDRLLAAFSIANSAAACGMRVRMFFTFWATALLRRRAPPSAGKRLVERILGRMLPAGADAMRLSRLDLGGLGRRLLQSEMRRKNIPDLPALMQMARTAGVELMVCGSSMELLGIRSDELIDYPGLRLCGATQFIDMATEGSVTLFV